MAKILAYTSPARGHLYPLTAILKQLQGRGHRVVVRTLAGEVPHMRQLGFDAEPVAVQVENITLEDWRERSPQKALAASVRTFVARAQFDAADLQSAIGEEAPDAVIVDVNSWGAIATAEQWGGPWSVFCPYPLPLASSDAPPYGPGLAPAHGLFGRVRDAILRPVVVGTLEKKMLPGVNEVRSRLGLEPLRHLDDQFRRPPLLIYLSAEPFEYAHHDWPDTVVMVGQCEWEPESNPPTWIDDLHDPLVVVTTSSEFQDDARLVRSTLAALADQPVQVVATMPAGVPDDLSVPANARVEQFLTHGPLLDRAACAVTHAGMGATQKALARGVPVVAVPFGRDQFEVARRVEVAGAGVRLPAKKLDPANLRRAVHRATGLRNGARAVAAGYRAAGGPVAAADVVEGELLGVGSKT